jgi:hypothetical protein
MSNISDLVETITGSNSDATDLAGAILGTLADLGGAAGAITAVYDQLSSQDDSLQQILSAIQQAFAQVVDQLQSQIAAGDNLARMRDIDTGINPAVSVFEQLPAILSSQPPASQDYKLAQIEACINAVLFFTDYDDKWKAVAAGLPSYSDTWSGSLAPAADGDGLVFNYTYTLPQFLRAISIFVTVVKALDSASLSKYTDVLNRCVSRLQSIHDTVTGPGIVGTRVPSGPGTDPTIWIKDWTADTSSGDRVQYPYGAVEIYSAANNIISYGNYLAWFDPEPGAPRYTITEDFFELVNLRVVRKMKELYVQVGMPAVREAITSIQKLAGEPVANQNPYESWPFDEVISLLHLPLSSTGPQPAWGEPAGLEQAIGNFLRQTPPFGPAPQTGQPVKLPPLPSGSLYTYLTGASVQRLPDPVPVPVPVRSA